VAAEERTAGGVSIGQLAALALMTASLLGDEVLLTRAVSIQHWHHLTAVVIAVALLGLGCAGSLAAAFATAVRRHERALMSAAALATAVSIPLSLALAGQVPLNMLALPWYGTQQAGWLLLYALCYMLPFFCGGAFIALAFMRWASQIGRCYAADLVGSALGTILVLVLLDRVLPGEPSLEATFRVTAVLPVAAFLLLEPVRLKRAVIAAAALAGVIIGFAGPRAAVSPSDFKALSVQLAERGARVLWQQDTVQSRLTLVQSPAQHQAPGLSIRSGREAPRQWQVYRDGDDAVPLLRDAGQGHYRTFFDAVLDAAAFVGALERPAVLLLPGNPSWNSWNAYWHGAASITLVEPDHGMADLLAGGAFPDQPFLPPGSRMEIVTARRFLQSSDRRFDVIMADMDNSPVGSAAARVQFMLTREALELMLDRLCPSGVLAFNGQVLPLPRDALRLIDSLVDVLRQRGLAPDRHLVMIRDWGNLLVMVSRRPFSQVRLEALSAWCRQWGFDRAAMPGLLPQEANRFHQKPDALYFKAIRKLLSEDAAVFVAAYPFALSATDDNRPFFYHFLRWGHWQEVRKHLGQSWMLYAGWGYLLSLLALAMLTPTAAALILFPLTAASLRRQIAGQRVAILGYFGTLGMGFMLIEIALIQKIQLLMNAPTSAFAVVVVAMLLGAGVGSLWAGRGSLAGGRPWATLLAIGILAPSIPGLIDSLAARWGAGAYGMQVGVTALLLFSLAVPMGTMLPRGIARIRHLGSGAVAWAWGINGFCSVLGALAAPLIAIEIGIVAVVGWAVGLYLGASLLFSKLG
jgi:hypothetical protein